MGSEISRIGNGTEYNGMTLINGDRAKNLVSGESNSIGGNMVNDSSLGSTKVASFAANGDYTLTKISNSRYNLSQVRDSGTTTSVNLDVSATTLAVADGTKFAAGDVIQVEDELMLVTATSSNDLTVTRGHAGTTAAAHDGSTTALDIDLVDQTQTVDRAGDQNAGFSDVEGNQINFDELGIVTDTLSSSSSSFSVDDGNYMTIQVGANNDADHSAANPGATENRITFNLADATSEGLAIDGIDLDSLGDAQSAINSLDAAIQKVSASLSTIQDADFAIEAADLARNQILTQSS